MAGSILRGFGHLTAPWRSPLDKDDTRAAAATALSMTDTGAPAEPARGVLGSVSYASVSPAQPAQGPMA